MVLFLLLKGGIFAHMDIQQRLKEIEEMGYIPSHRNGDTGIGKTFEDLLGIKENNLNSPDIDGIEVKTGRHNSNTPITLFTKVFNAVRGDKILPNPTKIFRDLYGTFKNDTDALYLFDEEEFRPREYLNESIEITLTGNRWTLLGESKFKLKVDKANGRVIIHSMNDEDIVFAYDFHTLQSATDKKLNHLLYVQASSIKQDNTEYFWYDGAKQYTGFSFKRFLSLIENGKICVDIRIGIRENGTTHDHGTAFRISPKDLNLLYDTEEVLLTPPTTEPILM